MSTTNRPTAPAGQERTVRTSSRSGLADSALGTRNLMTIAALLMGIMSVFTTPTGPAAIVGTLIGGAFVEAPLALMLYRKWTWWSFLISATTFGLLNGLGDRPLGGHCAHDLDPQQRKPPPGDRCAPLRPG